MARPKYSVERRGHAGSPPWVTETVTKPARTRVSNEVAVLLSIRDDRVQSVAMTVVASVTPTFTTTAAMTAETMMGMTTWSAATAAAIPSAAAATW